MSVSIRYARIKSALNLFFYTERVLVLKYNFHTELSIV